MAGSVKPWKLKILKAHLPHCSCLSSGSSILPEDALELLSKKLLFAPTRVPEELYLYNEDHWQTKNLAHATDHANALARHRRLLDEWIEATGDPGSETPEVYRMETDDQMKSTRNKASREAYRENAELYKRWAREGK